MDVRWHVIENRVRKCHELAAAANRGGLCRLSIGQPLAGSEDEIKLAAIEAKLKRQLPESFKSVLREFAYSVEADWSWPTEAMSGPFRRLGGGALYWDPDEIPKIDKQKSAAARAMTKYCGGRFALGAWFDSVAFVHIMNGDYIAVDVSPSPMNGKILYLAHEGIYLGPELGNGYDVVLANSFPEFLDKVSYLGCVGHESWNLEPFLSKQLDKGLDVTSELAMQWRAAIGISDLP